MINKTSGLLLFSGLILTLCSCAPVTIETSPSGAEVYTADGQTLLGTTPYKTQIWFSEKDLVVRQNRYFEAPVKLNYATAEKIATELRPTPVVVYSKPMADIYPAGSEKAIGKTPMKIPVDKKPATYVLKVADYYDQEVTISIDCPDPQIIELARRPIVDISATPNGAEVYENGKLLGTAPLREEISTSRTFEFRKANYFSKTLTLNGAPPYEASVELKPFPVIAVSATPSGAKIFHDGKLLGNDAVQLPVGKKTTLEVSANRYYPQTVVLTPESDELVNVTLKAMPYVTLTSEPAGATVFLNGKLLGTTPLEQLVEKETTYEIRKENFHPKTVTLNGKDVRPVIKLEEIPPPPVVTISSSPIGAEVSVDGKIIGITPVEQVITTPITVALSLEGYVSQTNTIDGTDLAPMITLEKKPRLEMLQKKGITPLLLGSIAAAVLAVFAAIIILRKKKKTT